MVKAKVETKELPLVSEGLHEATFEGVEEISTEYGLKWRWIFSTEENNKTVYVTGISSNTLSRRGKAYKWLCAIANRKFDEGETIDTDKFIGQKCLIETTNYKVGNINVSRVTNVLPAEVKTKKAKKQEETK